MDQDLEKVLQGLGISEVSKVESDRREETYKFYAPYEQAVAVWKKLRSEVPAMGYWPVICGSERHSEPLYRMFREAEKKSARNTPEGATPSIEEWIANRAKTQGEAPRGPWPGEAIPDSGIYLAKAPRPIPARIGMRGRLPERPPDLAAIMILLPVPEWLEFFTFVSFGGWNECPFPSEHVRILHYWGEKYGLELIAMRQDTLEFNVAKQPGTREEAIKLAEEQFLYCADIVEQGTGTLERLAAGLLTQDHWFFWWD
jgi:hypothetical protein